MSVEAPSCHLWPHLRCTPVEASEDRALRVLRAVAAAARAVEVAEDRTHGAADRAQQRHDSRGDVRVEVHGVAVLVRERELVRGGVHGAGARPQGLHPRLAAEQLCRNWSLVLCM